MLKRRFWTKKRMLPGQSAVEETANTYWTLKSLHPASASAMVFGASGLGYAAWWLLRDTSPWLALIAALVVRFIGAWVGLALYWLIRLILALND